MSDDVPGSAGDDAPETDGADDSAAVPAIRRVAGTGVRFAATTSTPTRSSPPDS